MQESLFALVRDLTDTMPTVGIAGDDKLSIGQIGMLSGGLAERKVFGFDRHRFTVGDYFRGRGRGDRDSRYSENRDARTMIGAFQSAMACQTEVIGREDR